MDKHPLRLVATISGMTGGVALTNLNAWLQTGIYAVSLAILILVFYRKWKNKGDSSSS